MIRSVLSFLQELFSNSAYLGYLVVLMIWMVMCWWHKLSTIGRKGSLARVVLRSFKLNYASELSLEDLARMQATQDNGETKWSIGELFLVHWTLAAKGFLVQAISIILGFAGFCLWIMNIAQPTASISLERVADGLGLCSLLPIAFMLALSLLKLWTHTSKLPLSELKEVKPFTVVFFAW